MSTPTILKKILSRKSEEIAERGQQAPIEQLRQLCEAAPDTRGFSSAVADIILQGQSAVIAEIKKASPSKGIIRENFQPAAIAQSYARHGAACLSVLTDVDFFQGSDAYLQQAREACSLPVLRKDFIIDEYQVYETRAMGADCLLLIVAAFNEQSAQLQHLAGLAQEIGLDLLVEVHNAEELAVALPLQSKLIGINNRDLHSFNTSLQTTYDLLDSIPTDRIVVTESGIHCVQDIKAMRAHQVNAFLVGEAFMRAPDPGAELAKLFMV